MDVRLRRHGPSAQAAIRRSCNPPCHVYPQRAVCRRKAGRRADERELPGQAPRSAIKVGTSTLRPILPAIKPHDVPAGGCDQAGSYAILDAKRNRSSAGPFPRRAERSDRGRVADGKVDMVIGYCTSGRLRLSQGLRSCRYPPLCGSAPNMVWSCSGCGTQGQRLAFFILSPEGQRSGELRLRSRGLAGKLLNAGAVGRPD